MWNRIKEGLSNYNPDSSKDPVVKDTVSISMIQTVYLGVEMPKMDFYVKLFGGVRSLRKLTSGLQLEPEVGD